MSADAAQGISSGKDEMSGLARDSGLNLAAMVVSQVAAMATVLVIARSIGNEAVGVYSQAFALRALLMLICALGTRVSMTHFVARYRADDDPGAVRGVARLGLGSTTIVAVAAGLGLVLSAQWLANDFFEDPALADPIRLAGLSLPFFVAMTVALAGTQGFKTMRAFAGVSLIYEPGARFILTALLILLGFGVGGAMWALLIAGVSAALLAVGSLYKYVGSMRAAPATYAPGVFVRFSAYSWVASIAMQGLLWSDVVILGALVSSADVGVYQVATRVVLLGTMVTPALTASLSPRVADSWRRGDGHGLQQQYRALTGWTFRLSLPILAVIVVFPQQILRVFGGGFDEGRVVIWWLVGGAIVETLSAPSAVTLNQANHNRANMAISVGALVLNIGLNLMLIPMYGISGAAIAWALSLVIPGAARIVAVKMLVTGIHPWNVAQTKAALAAVAAAAVAFGFRQAVSWVWILELALGATVVLVTYVGLIVVFGPAREDAVAIRAIVDGLHQHAFHVRRRLEKRRLRNRLSRLLRSSEPINLNQLVSPFRYDVEVRREFFELVAEHEALWRRDSEAFLRIARNSTYYGWYQAVAVKSIGIDTAHVEDVERGFERRVNKSLALFDEFRNAESFDRRYPITVRPIIDGRIGRHKRLSGVRHVPVDGCHRIALMILNGRVELRPDEYRIALDSSPILENTEQLVAALDIEPDRYYRFISRGFLPVEFDNRVELLASLREQSLVLAAEVDAIMLIDERAMGLRDALLPHTDTQLNC